MKLKLYFFVLALITLVHCPVFIQAQSDEYRKTLEMADNYFAQGDYINAKASYQIAVRLAPEESYPKEMLQQSLAMIRQQMSQSALYSEKIVVADELFTQKDYTAALKFYEEALGFLPGDTYATGKITEINNTLKENREREELYATTIGSADQYLKAGKPQEALAEYQKAAGIKPAEDYPKNQVAAIEKQLNEQKELAGDYESAIAAADEALKRNKFDEAIRQLEQAATLKPQESLPAEKLQEAKKKKADYEAYTGIIEEGDNLYISKDFSLAREKYLQATAINPADDYPKKMLEKIDIALMDISKANASSYEVAIALADKYYNEQDYERAMAEYRNALRFKPDESYAQQKINNINQTLSVIKSQQEAYAQAISKADNLFMAKSYAEAKEEYQRAIGINAFEQYPRVKIDEIDVILADLQSQREIYNNYIKGADKLFFADNYVEALEQYHKASDMFPKEQYPIDQITMIYEILGIRDRYTKSVTNADKLMMEKRYEEALTEYRNAAAIDGKEMYPQGKIYEIESLLAEQQRQESVRREYDSVLAIADARFTAGEYDLAMELYRSAQVILPGESYPGRKMEEILNIYAERENLAKVEQQFRDLVARGDELLADRDYQAAAQAYQSALQLKPGEQYPLDKLSEINTALGEIAAKEALEQQYRDVISQADQFLAAQNYSAALETYQSALKLKPGEAYPTEKIAEVNAALGEIAAKEAFEQQYRDVISQADQFLVAENYSAALDSYQSALKLKPGEAYPTEKIAMVNAALGEIAAKEALEIQYRDVISQADQLLAAQNYSAALDSYQSALKLKPGEAYPTEKIAGINSILEGIAAKDKQYQQYLDEGDALFAQGKFSESKLKYIAATELKPQEAAGISNKMAEIEAAIAEAARVEEINKKYNDAVSFAEKHLAAGDLENARYEFQVANSIKPGEDYPLQKIAGIDAALEEIRKQKELDNEYNRTLASADEFFRNDQLEEARAGYQEAKKIKPAEIYPDAQLAAINQKLELQAVERDQAYQVAISKADLYLEQGDYEMARIQYDRAVELKPNEVYPLDKLKLVNEQIMKKRQIIQAEYDKGIADADKYYASKIYDNAIDSYRAASLLKPDEEYPKEMVRRILKMISDRSIVQMNKDPLLIANNTQHKFDFLPVSVKDRRSNYIFFRARNVSDKEYKLIINFGQDQAKNGGVVVKVPPGSDINEYIVRISAQYKWFSDDNNWITFYPEGGDIEVSLLQISYSD